jgi:hypothetical protein
VFVLFLFFDYRNDIKQGWGGTAVMFIAGYLGKVQKRKKVVRSEEKEGESADVAEGDDDLEDDDDDDDVVVDCRRGRTRERKEKRREERRINTGKRSTRAHHTTHIPLTRLLQHLYTHHCPLHLELPHLCPHFQQHHRDPTLQE